MYKLFIGIDVSKGWIDVSTSTDHQPQYLSQYVNTIDGFIAMVDQIRGIYEVPSDQWLVCFENTGTYSKLLLEWLVSQQIKCVEENPLTILRSSGIQRGKSDKIDSGIICLYAFQQKESLRPTSLDSPSIQTMKKLLSRRDFLVKHRASLMASLKEQRSEFSERLYAELEKQNQILMTQYTEQIKWVEQEIKRVIKGNLELRKNDQIAQSVPGIGPITSWYLMVTSGNYLKIPTARKYACYGAIAPFPKSSGKSIYGKTRVSHLGNKKIKSLLSNCVLSAKQYDEQIKKYYNRKIAEGKHPGSVINAVKNKLVQRVYTCIKRGSEYVPLKSYA